MVNGKVIQRTIGPDGQVTGTYDSNPFLNSIIYDVEFPDGQVKEYAVNIIAENMLTQVDSDGMSTTLMEAIVDHQRDDEKALQHHDKYVQTKNGRRHLRKTTDRIPSTTPGAEPPRDAKDSGSARSHSTHLETSSSNRP